MASSKNGCRYTLSKIIKIKQWKSEGHTWLQLSLLVQTVTLSKSIIMIMIKAGKAKNVGNMPVILARVTLSVIGKLPPWGLITWLY